MQVTSQIQQMRIENDKRNVIELKQQQKRVSETIKTTQIEEDGIKRNV